MILPNFIEKRIKSISIDNIWESKISDIILTPAFRKCSDETKKYLKSQDHDQTYLELFSKCEKKTLIIEFCEKISPNMIPQEDISEFSRRVIQTIGMYLNFTLEKWNLETEPFFDEKQLNALQDNDYSNYDKIDEVYLSLFDADLEQREIIIPMLPLEFIVLLKERQKLDCFFASYIYPEINRACKRYMQATHLQNVKNYDNSKFIAYRHFRDALDICTAIPYYCAWKAYTANDDIIDVNSEKDKYEHQIVNFFLQVCFEKKWFPGVFVGDENGK